jgi:hypothetical protein
MANMAGDVGAMREVIETMDGRVASLAGDFQSVQRIANRFERLGRDPRPRRRGRKEQGETSPDSPS